MSGSHRARWGRLASVRAGALLNACGSPAADPLTPEGTAAPYVFAPL